MKNSGGTVSLLQQLKNSFYAIPAVAQWWARRFSRQIRGETGDAIPFARLSRPLVQSRVALITTGGVHLPDQQPFDMSDEDGDASLRVIPGDVEIARLTITHDYYNHTSADRDLNVIFPLEHLRNLAEQGVIGAVAPRHFGLMGHIEGEHLGRLVDETAPEIARSLAADQVDFALLTPA